MQTGLEPRGRGALGARPAASRTAVRLRGVTRRFTRPGAPPLVALERLSLEVAAGEVVAVVGASGAGKTTLLELVCRLQAPDAGEVSADPAVLMPQRDLLLPWLDALDNAALALRLAGRSRADARRLAGPTLAALGLDGFARRRPRELSGGMRQRVAFARTVLSGRPVLCLDEPFGALDAITRAELQGWLEGVLAAAPKTVLLVTHDIEEAVVLADRVLVLSRRPGRVVAELPVAAERPRSRTDPAVLALREQALEALR
jgi:ABC-type nitrate/sulfonate/bicarbonate transport system ATPase subunit